jgi:hypothetical protein
MPRSRENPTYRLRLFGWRGLVVFGVGLSGKSLLSESRRIIARHVVHVRSKPWTLVGINVIRGMEDLTWIK